jgi:hypothetical protein
MKKNKPMARRTVRIAVEVKITGESRRWTVDSCRIEGKCPSDRRSAYI